MATPGELVRVIAASTGEDHSTVASHDRNLVVAGLRSKSGRGTSAATVTPRDAAHVLTALLGSARVKDSVDTVRRYMQTQENHAYERQHFPESSEKDQAIWAQFDVDSVNVWRPCGIPELAALPADHSFIDALTALIKLASNRQDLIGFMRVIVASPNTSARITMSPSKRRHDAKGVVVNYRSNEPPPEWMTDRRKKPPPAQLAQESPRLNRNTEMNALPIIYIGALLAGKLDELPAIPRGASE